MQPKFRPLERTFVALVASSSLGVTAAHSINALLRNWLPALGQTSASTLTLTVILVSFAFAAAQLILRRQSHLHIASLALPGVGMLGAALIGDGLGSYSITVLLVGMLDVQLAGWISSRLPSSLDLALRRHPGSSLLWAALGILLLIQAGRLGTYMADPSADWWLTTKNEWWAKHMCMPAYIQAADYVQQGVENVYDERHYPAVTRNASVHLAVRGMDAFVGDPYQYPPQFLLAPSMALWLTQDFQTMRTVWYGLQVFGFVLVAVLLARWIQPEAGWTPMLLIPLVWISVPAMQCFQYGQFHLATIVLAVAGLLAFEHRRDWLGGLLLAVAILSKLFPVILLIPMVVERRWKSLAWILGFAGLLTFVAMAVVGTAPFTAFVGYQLPRLSNGEALASFTKEWPELREVVIANVVSLYGVVFKLRELGVPGMSDGLALWTMRLYTVIVLVVAVRAGRGTYTRLSRAALWLALLNLAALQTSLAWGDYVTVGSVWLLSLLAMRLHQLTWQTALLGACWAFAVLNLGIVPIATWSPAVPMMIISSAGALLLCVFNIWIGVRREPKRRLATADLPTNRWMKDQ